MLERYIQNKFQRELFSGTTLENFKASVTQKCGKVIYQRPRNHPGNTAGTYFDLKGIEYPATVALSRAKELNHSPLVYATRLWNSSEYFKTNPYVFYVWLPQKALVTVSRLWLPDENWRKYIVTELHEDEKVALFNEVPTKEIQQVVYEMLRGSTTSGR